MSDSSSARLVCEVRQLPDLAALVSWAQAQEVPVDYLGPTTEGRAMFGASAGAVSRVAVSQGPDLRRPPLKWNSPLCALPPVRAALSS